MQLKITWLCDAAFQSSRLKYREDNNNKINADRFIKLNLANGVILRGLKSFGLPNSVRITIGTMDENKFFVNNLNNIINEI